MSVNIPSNATSAGTYLSNAQTWSTTQTFVFMCWFYLTGTPTNNDIFNAEGTNDVPYLLLTSNPQYDFGSLDSDNYVTSPIPVVGRWTHICYVWIPSSTSKIRGYVNGNRVITATSAGTVGSITSLTLGNQNATDGATLGLGGNISDVRCWNQILSDAQVWQEYQSCRPVNKNGLVIWSPFDTEIYNNYVPGGKQWTAVTAGATPASLVAPMLTSRTWNKDLTRKI